MRGHLLTFGAGAVLLVGCLFPSFDGLKSDDVKAGPTADDDDDTSEGTDSGKKPKEGATSSSGSESSSSSSSSGTTTSSSSSSSSGDASTATRSIRCHDKACTGDTICCAPIFGDYACKPRSNPDCGDNDILVCDGAEDCAPGQFCCQGGPQGGASVCQSAPCSGFTYCQTGSVCPQSIPSCSGSVPGGPDDFKSCQ